MKEKQATKATTTVPDYRLDITAEVCPLTFVRTRLQLERMNSGEILEIRLCGEEPLENVPRALAEEGHEILSFAPETGGAAFRLLVRKSG